MSLKSPIKFCATRSFIMMVFISFLPVVWSMSKFAVAAPGDMVYDTAIPRDPFLPLIGQDVVLSDVEDLEFDQLALEGIIYDPVQGSFAIINGEVFRRNEVIGGFRITKIEEQQVSLIKEDAVYTLKLLEDMNSK